jgi:hypothetical protein
MFIKYIIFNNIWNMNKFRKIAFGVIILGFLMFLIGASLFAYRGNINALISKIGMISFLFWFPTIIIGIVLVFLSRNKK